MLDPRIIRVGFEIDGQLRMYSDGWITASGTKFANPLQNEATVQIANLAKEVRHYLLTETSPFNDNRKPKRLVIEAGRESIGASRVFVGDITSAVSSQPPDIIMTVKAKTEQYAKGNIVAMSAAPLERLSVLSQRVADSLNLRLLFEASDTQVKNWTFTGANLALVKKLSQVGAVNAFIDDKSLVVKNWGAALTNTSHILSMANGMVGVPEATEYGCKVTMMFDPRVRLGGRLELQSMVNPAMDGAYTIFKLDFNLQTRDTPFYWVAHCTRDGWKNAKRIPE